MKLNFPFIPEEAQTHPYPGLGGDHMHNPLLPQVGPTSGAQPENIGSSFTLTLKRETLIILANFH